MSASIESLPYETLFEIAIGLKLNEIASLCKSNKQFSQICKSDQFWLMKIEYDGYFKQCLIGKRFYRSTHLVKKII